MRANLLSRVPGNVTAGGAGLQKHLKGVLGKATGSCMLLAAAAGARFWRSSECTRILVLENSAL